MIYRRIKLGKKIIGVRSCSNRKIFKKKKNVAREKEIRSLPKAPRGFVSREGQKPIFTHKSGGGG